MLFKELSALYMELHALKLKVSWRDDVRFLRLYLKPAFGEKPINEIRRIHIEQLHADISKSSPVSANRTLALVHSMFERAIEWELLDRNPARGVRRNPETPRRRVVDPEEMPRLLRAIAQEQPMYRSLFLLYLLLGCRKRELLTLKWSQIDRERKTATILRTKAKRPQVLPLTDHALALFDSVPRGNSEYIFAIHDKPLSDVRRPWRRVLKAAGITALHIHDLRRTFASGLLEHGASLIAIRDALNHSSVKVTQTYTVVQKQELRETFGLAEKTIRYRR